MKPRLLLWLFLILTAATKSFAQLYPFDHYTSKDGLLSNYVLAICADSHGYIWIGTDDGLSQYNGDSFRNLTVADGLAFSRVTCLIESRKEPGTLWIGTNGGGISKLEDYKFRTLRVGQNQRSNMISSILEDKSGTLWCGTVDGLYRLVGDEFRPSNPGTYPGTVNGVAQSADGSLWVLLPEHLFMVPPNSETPQRVKIQLQHGALIECVHAAADSTVWIGLSDGELIQLRGDKIIRRLFFRSAGIAFMMDDGDGYLVVTTNGIYRLESGGKTAFLYCSTANGLPENYITSGAVDREGNLWFGLGTRGVAKLANRSIVTLPIQEISFAPNGSCAAVDGNNHLWVVSNAGIWEVWMGGDHAWNQALHRESQASIHRIPFTLLFDPPSSLWVGYNDGPIACFHIELRERASSSLRLTHQWTRGSEFPHGAPLFLFNDKEGYIWSSMNDNRGVCLFDPRRSKPFVRSYNAADGMPDNSIRAIFEDHAGNFWFGGYDNGLTLLPAKQKLTGGGRRFTSADGLPNMSIRSMDEDSSGTLWVGTRYGGLAYYHDSVFSPISLKDGLISTAIWSMTNGTSGHWLGTQLGFQEIVTKQPVSFSSKKELVGRPVYACGELNTGWLWLVTDEGMTLYDRGHDLPNNVPPPIYLSSVRVNGVGIDFRRPLHFAYDQNSITVDVVGLSFKDEKAVRYQYKLTGDDTAWSAPTDHHSIIFAALSPGTYTFMARAINASGVTSILPAEFTFSIAPPLWRTWWFITSCLFVVGIVAFMFVRIRIQRLLEIERIRSRIATDLHDDIGAGLTRIAILSSVAERELPRTGGSNRGKIHTVESLKRIGDTARELVDSMSDVVWSLELGGEPLERLVHRLRSFAFEACEAKDISLKFVVDDRIFALQFTPENARNILLCAKEAITNVVRHAKCTEAFVEFGFVSNCLRLTVKDNGKGFKAAEEGEGHGLSNMQKRANRTGGEFTILSNADDGTEIRASFPAKE